jgi:lysozyme
MTQINPLVVDLSHWDPADNYEDVKRDGIVGVIYKATEGQSYTDDTYVGQQHAAKAVGLKWGSYHFADASSVAGQIDNYLRFAAPDPDELFCLDWEDNPTGAGMMSVGDCKTWIAEVENALRRPGQCVIYSGNTAKEQLGDRDDSFFGSRRLWHAQYGSTPSWQASWDNYWLWQFTDGVYGPTPHKVDGIGPCDINSYDGSAEELIAEWATGQEEVPPDPQPEPDQLVVNVLVNAPPGVVVKVRQFQVGPSQLKRSRWRDGHD